MKEQINKNKTELTEIDKQEKPEEILQKQSSKASKDNLTTYIILGVGLLIILTMAVLIGLKYQASRNATTTKNTQDQAKIVAEVSETESPTSKPLTKEDLLKEAFFYPNTLSEQDDWDFDLVFYTNDPAKIVYQYYEDLIKLNNWNLGPSGLATGDETGFFHIYQNDFNVDINISTVDSEQGLTKIEIRIDPKDTTTITSSLNRPSIQPTPPRDTELVQKLDEKDYILSFSNSRKITRDDLVGLTDWQLKVARNEIFARHGRAFVHQDLSCYFHELAWYEIDSEYSENLLSPLEVSNAVFILNYEKEINSSLIDKDTGCKQ
jgi:hypothetical protein